MIWDLIPLFPFNYLFRFKNSRLLYLLKIIRMKRAFVLLNTRKFKEIVDSFYSEKMQKAIEDPRTANDTILDHTNIMMRAYILSAFNTIRLFIIISMVTFFLSIFYYIYLTLAHDVNQGNPEREDNFLDKFNIQQMSIREQCIATIYFLFTSLSTVGLGDYHPRSNDERILGVFVLLFGVMIFSSMMGNFIDIIQVFSNLDQEFEDAPNLSRFLGTLQYFNNGKVLKEDTQQKIIDYFAHKWSFDDNLAVQTPEDYMLLT